MKNSLINFLLNIHPVDSSVLEDYTSYWSSFEAPRKTLLTSAGFTEHYLYFVLEGVQKSFYLNGEKEHVIAFTYAPSFTGIPDSFLSQQPSKYYLETLEDSRFLRISYEKHMEYLERCHSLDTLFRKATEAILIGVLERHYELMSLTIEERFKSFMERSSHLLQMVPHKDLASYLRIDPTNFSKLLSSVRL